MIERENETSLPEENKEDIILDNTLRPRTLKEFVGQMGIRKNLEIIMGAAKKRGETCEHILIHGSAGLGKTTLAHIIAGEMGGNFRVTSGPAIERAGDLAALLTNLEAGDILFIDEIHRINKNIEEVLYPAMEEYVLDIIVGKGPSAKTLRLNLPPFTLIGATTKLSMLSAPLRDRFGALFRLSFYTTQEMATIINRSAKLLNLKITNDAVNAIAIRSRQTPRIANRLLKRVRDFADMHDRDGITENECHEALTLLEVDEKGLDATDRKILDIIITKYKGGPVGLNTIAAAIAEEMATIEEIYEPFLLQLGFIERTPRGRLVTHSAYEHLKIKPPKVLKRTLNL